LEQNKILYVSPLSWNAELVNIAILKHSLLSDASHSVNRSRPSCCALEVAIVDLKSSMKGGSVYICNVNKLCIPAQRRHIRVHFWYLSPGQLTSFMFILSYEDGFYKPTVLKVHPPISGVIEHATMPGRLQHSITSFYSTFSFE